VPKIRAHSPESAWVPSLDACRTKTTDRMHQVERRKAEAKAKALVKAMPIGQPVQAVWKTMGGKQYIRRGTLLECVPWHPEPSVLVATILLDDGQTLRVDATRLRRAKSVH
jgi:hypothetical protein